MPEIDPYQVTPETWVIPDELPVPGVGQLPVNSMVITGEQPMLVDTLAIVHRDSYLERAFAIVEPSDVRWLFISHEDRDHTGSVIQVLDQCPNARLVTNFLGFGKLAEEFSIAPERAYFLNDGESLDLGDRTITAMRPPLYDSSATRGFFDQKTGVYFAADCFGAVVDANAQWSDDLSGSDFEEGFFWMNRANHVWFHNVSRELLERAAHRVRELAPTFIVSGHAPTVRRDTDRVLDWIPLIADMEEIAMPSQVEFERMLAGD